MDRIDKKLDFIIRRLDDFHRKEVKRIMATLDEVLADVQAEKTVDDSLIALTSSIKDQLDKILAGGLTPDQQAKVDAIFAGIEANKKAVADAVVANTVNVPQP
jgi:hypothetical protein